MPRHNIDKTAPVQDLKKRTITFCKRKKELLIRAIELSNMCCVDVMLVVNNPETHRLSYFTSSPEFTIKAASEAKRVAQQPEHVHMFERFTNADYDLLQERDFRGVRYVRKEVYQDDDDEVEPPVVSKRLVKADQKQKPSPLKLQPVEGSHETFSLSPLSANPPKSLLVSNKAEASLQDLEAMVGSVELLSSDKLSLAERPELPDGKTLSLEEPLEEEAEKDFFAPAFLFKTELPDYLSGTVEKESTGREWDEQFPRDDPFKHLWDL